MIAFVMIMRDVLGHALLEVLLAERHDSIQTLMFDGPNKALSMGIQIRRPPRRLHDADAAIAQQPAHRLAPLGVPITNQYAMRAQQPFIRPRQRASYLPHE